MKILIETIPHGDQRYPTVGDWQWKKPHVYGPSRVGHGEGQCIYCLGTNRENAVIDKLPGQEGGCPCRLDADLHIKVSQMSDWRYEVLVGLHEAIEALLCKQAGVDEAQVDNFDLGWEDNRVMGQESYSEPGNHPNAPYHRQHQFATAVENALALELDVNWSTYEAEVDSL